MNELLKLDIQNFAENTQLGSAVVGHRLWISENTVPVTVNDPILGVRNTPDLGSAQNTVEANVISSIREENVLGLFPSTDISYTFLLNDKLIKKMAGMIGKEVWVYEERENMTSTPKKMGKGIVYKIKLGGLVATGQTPEGLQEFTQSGTMISDETYWATPEFNEGADTIKSWSYLGMQTGKTATDLASAASLSRGLK